MVDIKAYDGLTQRQQLNLFRNLHYNDGNATENGIIANAINDYCADVAPKSEVERMLAECERLIKVHLNCAEYSDGDLAYDFAELKKKYTEEKE